ncbi:zinc-binding alcohol dehydrogenase family protein [Acinetobacter sp. WU_MDCI_Abxe161]|uniref:zinc-binding alcohol dehydrogenase family protein n=1 Tax=Acinetobacter TaxID=469 RepID=UPI001CD6E231|nr:MULTISPECIES: zinc-binding alcohol dehydrogenase family protein [Acinetobacter]MCU4504048.1 zinc-binding alcohol dehydrogenase family protein [Acinetobacter sp. WU_MDCI_Abxe161]
MNSKINYAVAICEPLELEHPDSFLDVQIPYPQTLPHDVIVKVQAISINPADTRARRRKTKDGQTTILGWDVVGTITEMGTHVSEKFNIGDTVYYAGDISRSGGNCTYHAIDSRLITHTPTTISIEDAAALPLVSLTAWEALAERLSLQISTISKNSPQDTHSQPASLLIIGGAGGVGSMAIQLAKLAPQLTVIATASRQQTSDWCRKLGADHIVDHTQDIPTQLAQIGYAEVDYILICNSPDSYFNILPSITKPFGKICSIVPFSHLHDFNLLMKKSLSFHWELMFTRSSFQTPDMTKQSEILSHIAKMIDQNIIISPRLTSLHPINAKTIKQAHLLIESNKTIGKIVVVSE